MTQHTCRSVKVTRTSSGVVHVMLLPLVPIQLAPHCMRTVSPCCWSSAATRSATRCCTHLKAHRVGTAATSTQLHRCDCACQAPGGGCCSTLVAAPQHPAAPQGFTHSMRLPGAKQRVGTQAPVRTSCERALLAAGTWCCLPCQWAVSTCTPRHASSICHRALRAQCSWWPAHPQRVLEKTTFWGP